MQGHDTERLKFRGRLAEKQEAASKLRLRIEGDLRAVREILDPFANINDVRVDLAAAQAVEMANKHAEYLGLLSEIKAIEKALGHG